MTTADAVAIEPQSRSAAEILRRITGSAVVRRLAMVPVVGLLVAVIVFFVAHALPGDPVDQLTSTNATVTEAEIVEVRESLGLNASMPVQLWNYVTGLFTGDLGESFYSGRSVASLLADAVPVTVELALAAVVLTVFMGVATGILAARYQGTWIDSAIRVGATIGFSLPWFVVALVAIIVFGVQLGWLPILGRLPSDVIYDPTTGFILIDAVLQNRYDLIGPWLTHLILPAFTLAATSAGFLTRVTRAAFLDARSQPYVRTARMKGLTERAIEVKHILRNAAVPILTMSGLQLGGLLGGAVIIESVFSYPGVGSLLVEAVDRRDYFLLQGAALAIALMFTLVNAIVDLAMLSVDPRLRRE
ncbi:ABC transporter permease [Prescottella equi]|uniref:ABC transporter permease n=1 Tax=Rhodococcus hoagii TaxID=43767 RepID=UPI00274039D6|nr:ABC transporter permease [Prescottella equi]MDP8015167.1 ABC transporter permease [Prescottella equi]